MGTNRFFGVAAFALIGSVATLTPAAAQQVVARQADEIQSVEPAPQRTVAEVSPVRELTPPPAHAPLYILFGVGF